MGNNIFFYALNNTNNYIYKHIHTEFLAQLYGLGEQSAKELYKKLLSEKLITKRSGPDDVLEALKHPKIFPELPVATRLDIIERPDKQIPNEVIKILDQTLHKRITGIKFQIAGSYKRKKPISRDVDLVMSRGSWNTSLSAWKSFIKQIQGVRIVKFHKPFAGGNDKLSVLVSVSVPKSVLDQIKRKHPGKPELHKRTWKLKTDVFVTDTSEYMFMLLYATGSGQFNVMMRAQAKRKGYMLNQKGLYIRSSNKRVKITNEKALFKLIGVKYRKPENRS